MIKLYQHIIEKNFKIKFPTIETNRNAEIRNIRQKKEE